MSCAADPFAEVVPTRSSAAEAGCAGAFALEGPPDATVRLRILTSPLAATFPEAGEVLVWMGTPCVAGVALRRTLDCWLTGDDDAAASRSAGEDHYRAVIAARAALHAMLSRALDFAPDQLRLTRGPHGKPALSTPARERPLHFSVSHTDGAVAVGLSRTALGVDVETIRDLPELQQIAELTFAPEARVALYAADAANRTEMFYRLWVLSEAFTKATGLGLSMELQSFAILAGAEPLLLRSAPDWGPPERWRLGYL